jgi:hypothetical protein
MTKKTTIFARFRIPGVHHWPTADETRTHGHLIFPHRHMFHIHAEAQVKHSDRDIEFLELADKMKDFLFNMYGIGELKQLCDFSSMSCEDIAETLAYNFPMCHMVEVSEDGEGGARIVLS